MNPQPDNSSFIQILNQVIHHLLKMPNYLVEDEAGLTRITDLVRCLVTYSMNYLVNYCGICLWIIWWRRRLVRYRITDLPPNKQSGCVLLAPPTPPFPYFRAKTNKQKRNQATNWTTVVPFFLCLQIKADEYEVFSSDGGTCYMNHMTIQLGHWLFQNEHATTIFPKTPLPKG